MSVSLFCCHPSGCRALVDDMHLLTDNPKSDGIAALEGFLESFVEVVVGCL